MISRLLEKSLRLWRMKRDPVAYVRSLGVTVGEGTHFYALEEATFGTEPFLVTLGRNVHVTAGVRFVTHDGAPLIFRSQCAKYPDTKRVG